MVDRYKKGTNVVGRVGRAQTPMLMSFEEAVVNYITEYLYEAIDNSNQLLSLFSEIEEDFDPFSEE